jgi:hypothetical protein
MSFKPVDHDVGLNVCLCDDLKKLYAEISKHVIYKIKILSLVNVLRKYFF